MKTKTQNIEFLINIYKYADMSHSVQQQISTMAKILPYFDA
jgi:hypothetical protein